MLDDANGDPRGIWSDGEAMWVLDGGDAAVYRYDLETGGLLARYELDDANGDPHGIWSDGTTIWVSDDGDKRLFAYRLGGEALDRVTDEQFGELSGASNNSPRGIWSNGDVMYVADGSDDKVYSYNMPDAIDARLASLPLSGIEIGEFLPGRTEYDGVATDGVAETTVEAGPVQDDASVTIDPPDADEEADGHQVALEGVSEIIQTVTSADGSRERVYRVGLGVPEQPEEAATSEPAPDCLRGAVAVGFSLVVYAGGSIKELEACARSRHIVTLYALHDGAYVSYILGAPEFVNEPFVELFADGFASLTPLAVKSDGPATTVVVASGPAESWAACLRGEIVEGFSLVVYEGGSVAELDACAEEVGFAALYVLDDGVWVSYLLSAPEFANRDFRELFTDGLPVATPLVGKSN